VSGERYDHRYHCFIHLEILLSAISLATQERIPWAGGDPFCEWQRSRDPESCGLRMKT